MRARDNPFRIERVHQVAYRLPGAEWDAVLDRLAALGGRCAVVGPRGHGKTTCLEELGRRLEASGRPVERLRLEPEAPPRVTSRAEDALAAVAPGTTLLLDGAGLLSRAWTERAWRALPPGAGLVVTAHEPGRWPVLVRCETSPELLTAVVDHLRPRPVAGEPDATTLWQRYAGDLRGALRELFDFYSTLPQPQASVAPRDGLR